MMLTTMINTCANPMAPRTSPALPQVAPTASNSAKRQITATFPSPAEYEEHPPRPAIIHERVRCLIQLKEAGRQTTSGGHWIAGSLPVRGQASGATTRKREQLS